MKKLIGAALIALLMSTCMLCTEAFAARTRPLYRPEAPKASVAPKVPRVSEAQYFLASGRWDNTVIVINLEKAIEPANDATENAVVNRLRVTQDIDPTGSGKFEPASGQPIYITMDQERMRAYVTNHSGNEPATVTGSYELGWDATALSSTGQHGYPANIAVVDLEKALDPENWGTLGAVEKFIDAHGNGATSSAISPDRKYLAVAIAESYMSEDGGRWIQIFDLDTLEHIGTIEMAYDPTFGEGPRFSPDPGFGGYPCPNGTTFSPLNGGTLFSANGGTIDVSVFSWPKALAGDPGAELGRIPTQSGGFGISSSPDGKYVAVTSRENPQNDSEGNTISIIDVEKALTDPANAEVNRILVGTDDPDESSRPFCTAYTPDGSQIIATCFRTNNITIMDAAEAHSGKPVITKHISLEMPDGTSPSRPRGIAFSADGAYMAITGAPPKGKPGSGVVWILDTKDWTVKGRVTGIGNESYLIGGFIGPEM